MKNLLMICLFVLLPVSMIAQAGNEILVFSVQGDVSVTRAGKTFPCKRAGNIIAGDVVMVKQGQVSLVSRNLKRVTLDKKGRYSYQHIATQFGRANASLENRFLVQVLDKMTKKPGEVAYAGGVIRGERAGMYPLDSAMILGDEIRFRFANPDAKQLTFFVLTEDSQVLFSTQTKDSSFTVKRSKAGWWKPGTFHWEAVTPDKQGTAEQKFFIPAEGERKEMLEGLEQLRKIFSKYPKAISKQLMEEVVTSNRWVK